MQRNVRIFLKSFSYFFLIILTTSCVSQQLRDVQINDLRLQVEIADEPSERERGLMYRTELPANQGMLFVFSDTARQRVFWMKNTSIPLSIAFMNEEGIIIEIYDMIPHSTDPLVSRYPARYALEVVQGLFSQHGVRIGDRMQFSELPEE